MNQTVLHNITPPELSDLLRAIVRQEVQAALFRPVTKSDVCKLWGCSMATVNRAMRCGELRSVRTSGHPVFNYADVVQSRRFADANYL